MPSELEKRFAHFFDKPDMVNYLKSNPEETLHALKTAQKSEEPQGWRVCWVLRDVLSENDPDLLAEVDNILNILPDRPDGHQRELLHLLEKADLNDDQEGILFDICITLWESVRKIPSVRYTAFQFIAKTIRKYPELKNEISHLVSDEYMDTLSPGIRKSVRKVFAEL